MRTRFRRAGALLPVAFAAVLVSACSDGAGPATARSAPTAPSSRPGTGGAHHQDDMGGMDMGSGGTGGMGTGGEMGGMDMGHDASMPPLATRLADATPAQRDAAADLLARTKATIAPYASEPAARAAGFVPANVTKRIIHYRNVTNRRDDHELDPTRPEGLVYFRGPTGAMTLLGALYTARPGEPAPTPGGDIFSWHTHDPSCGTFLVPSGGCATTFRMLHVWTAPRAADPWIQPVQLAFGRTG